MKIGLFLEGSGRNNSEWRHPEMPLFAGTHFGRHKEQTLIAEQAKFDLAFIADTLFAGANVPVHFMNRFEAVSAMAALASVTSRIGLVSTISTTFTEPYNLARQILSIDHISGGRAGWNLVTTDPKGAGDNFGLEKAISHEERFKIAKEYLDVIEGLWDSYEDDALVQDKDHNIFLDPTKLHTMDHRGQYFRVKGPLNICRSPQGRPVVFTATSSDDGKSFAGRRVDAVFTVGDISQNQALYREVKALAAEAGRASSQVLIMPGVRPIIAATTKKAQEIEREQRRQVGHDGAFRFLRRYFADYDLGKHNLSDPFPKHLFEENESYQGDVRRMAKAVEEENLTVGEFVERFGYPPSIFVGSPEKVASEMQRWFETEACDGFMYAECLPGQLRLFADNVVPILQEMGVFRTEYEGTTLREHLGLDRPQNVHLRREVSVA